MLRFDSRGGRQRPGAPGAAAAGPEQAREGVELVRNLAAGIDLQRQNATSMAEASLQMAVANGQLSRLDAAQAQAALHTQEYTDAVERLHQALANVADDPSMNATEKAAAAAGLNNQLTQLKGQGQRAIQVPQDQQAIVGLQPPVKDP